MHPVFIIGGRDRGLDIDRDRGRRDTEVRGREEGGRRGEGGGGGGRLRPAAPVINIKMSMFTLNGLVKNAFERREERGERYPFSESREAEGRQRQAGRQGEIRWR